MAEDRILISIDFSTASELLVELLLEDALDPSSFADIANANMNRPAIMRLLLDHPDTPQEVRDKISASMCIPTEGSSDGKKIESRKERISERGGPDEGRQTILQQIQKLKVAEKIFLAMRGGKEIRSLLLRDTNREVSLTVLDNAKITESEIEMIARSRSISDEALRKITKKREWMKNYGIIHALVNNPKTPPGIGLSLVSALKVRDLGILEKNRNVSEGVRSTAKKVLRARKGQ